MDQNRQNYEKIEIDIRQYIKVIVKRKKTLIAVLLSVLAIGVVNILFSPKIYRISIKVQPPVSGPSITGSNDLESAENLKGLIINGAFNDDIKKLLNMDLGKNDFKFNAEIPNKTNLMLISIDLEKKKIKFGIDLLQALVTSMSDRFTKIIEAKISDISRQIKLNEQNILKAKERAKNIDEQIIEISIRENKLLEELKIVNSQTNQVWEKRDLYLKESASSGNSPALFLASYLQNNANYLNQLNNQSTDLSIRRANLSLELKNNDAQINGFQIAISKLNMEKGFISNLRVVEQLRVSANPISTSKKKTLVSTIVMGLFFGLLTVFLQEFRVNNLVKK